MGNRNILKAWIYFLRVDYYWVSKGDWILTLLGLDGLLGMDDLLGLDGFLSGMNDFGFWVVILVLGYSGLL